MPLYEYKCPNGHLTEAIVKIDGSNAPQHCEHSVDGEACKGALTKILSVNARSFPGADKW